MTATHTLDGKPITRGLDTLGKPYFKGANNLRVATKGREADIKPIEEIPADYDKPRTVAELAAEQKTFLKSLPSDIKDVETDLTEFPFLAVGVAIAAIMAGHRYHECGPYVANKDGDRAAILSMPHPGGGNVRYRLEFPETLLIAAELAE